MRPEGTGLFEMVGRGPAWRWCVPHQHPGLEKTHQKSLNTMSACDVQDALSCMRRRVTAFVMLLSSASGREGGTYPVLSKVEHFIVKLMLANFDV